MRLGVQALGHHAGVVLIEMQRLGAFENSLMDAPHAVLTLVVNLITTKNYNSTERCSKLEPWICKPNDKIKSTLALRGAATWDISLTMPASQRPNFA